MEIIRTTDLEQSIKVLPRSLDSSVRFELIDKEQESNKIDQMVISTIEDDFIIVPFSANFFKEGRNYFISIYNTSDERIWRGEAFCTDETDLQNYSIDG